MEALWTRLPAPEDSAEETLVDSVWFAAKTLGDNQKCEISRGNHE